ncbi:MAG: C4-type zinc ribbon domain-containing protein [Brevinematia bacterium]
MKIKELSSEDVLNFISILIEVQEIYSQITEYREGLNEKFKKIDNYKKELGRLSRLLQKYESKKKELLLQKDVISENLASNKKRLIELMEREEEIARNQRTIESFNIEITTIRATISTISEELMDIEEQINDLEDRYAETKEKYNNLQIEFQAEEKVFQEETKEVLSKIKKLEETQKEKLSKVPLHIAQHFSNILQKKKGIAIVPVDSLGEGKKFKEEYHYCTGCNIVLPYVVVEKIKLKADIVQCPSCFRYLYDPSWFQKEQTSEI